MWLLVPGKENDGGAEGGSSHAPRDAGARERRNGPGLYSGTRAKFIWVSLELTHRGDRRRKDPDLRTRRLRRRITRERYRDRSDSKRRSVGTVRNHERRRASPNATRSVRVHSRGGQLYRTS